jgi:hypothetical protein
MSMQSLSYQVALYGILRIVRVAVLFELNLVNVSQLVSLDEEIRCSQDERFVSQVSSQRVRLQAAGNLFSPLKEVKMLLLAQLAFQAAGELGHYF